MAEAGGYPSLGGYDDAFVEVVDEDLKCGICQFPLKDPILTRCGHKFCNQCLEGHFQRLEQEGQPLRCPVDRGDLSRERADIFPDKSTERKILSLAIKCPSEGCKWTGELRSKENHLESCPLKVVPCTNLNCGIKVARKDLQEHVTVTCGWRNLQCRYCHVLHPACRTKAHQTNCRRYPIKCPQLCGEGQTLIPREEIKAHIQNTCLLTKISCQYAEMGCTTKIQRRSAEDHLQSSMGRHLDLVCLKLNETTTKLTNTTTRLNNTEQKLKETTRKFEEMVKILVTRQPRPPMNEWKIDLVEVDGQRLRGNAFNSPPFCDKTGYTFRLILRLISDFKFDISFVIMKGEYDSILPWPFRHEVKITVINRKGLAPLGDSEQETFCIYSTKGGFEILDRPFPETVCKPVSCSIARGVESRFERPVMSYLRSSLPPTMLIRATISPPE